MPRLMSVSHTTDAVRARTKTVTRRTGWLMLKAGDRLTLCEKVMGRRKGDPLVRICDVEVVDVRREKVWDITEADIAAEGVPVDDGRFGEVYTDTGQPTPLAWIEWFCEAMGVRPDDDVTRIEWRYLDDPCPECHNQFDGKMPGHVYGSNWPWVPCQTCQGVGLIPREPAGVGSEP